MLLIKCQYTYALPKKCYLKVFSKLVQLVITFIIVNTRFNSLILQKNIKISGNLETNETALTNELNCHQNVNKTTDNQDQNGRIEVVVSDSPLHSVLKKIYKDQEGGSDSESDEDEKFGDEIPDDLTKIDVGIIYI